MELQQDLNFDYLSKDQDQKKQGGRESHTLTVNTGSHLGGVCLMESSAVILGVRFPEFSESE